MMYRALIDTNVVVDLILERAEFADNAKAIFKLIASGNLIGYVSSSAITDIYYIVEGKMGANLAWEIMEYLYRTLRILPVVRKTIRSALDSNMDDFEDAVQTAAAQDFGVDIVVTRDKTGFSNSGLQVYLPEEFLETLK